jgi:hypothetical protein
MSIIVSHILREPYFKITNDDIFVVKKTHDYTVYNIRIHVDAEKMFNDDIIEVAVNITGQVAPDTKYQRNISFDVTKAFPNNMEFADTQSSFSYATQAIKLTGIDRILVSSQLKDKLKNNIDPIAAAITKSAPSSYNKLSGISSLKDSEFIYDVVQDDTSQVKQAIPTKLKTLSLQFTVPSHLTTARLIFILTETGENKMPRSHRRINVECRKKLLKFLTPDSIPAISGAQAAGTHVLNVFHPDKKIKKLKLLSKTALSNNFSIVGVYNASSSSTTVIKVPSSLPALYRVQGHGLAIAHENTKYGSCAVGNFEKINMKRQPILTVSQEDAYVNVRFLFNDIDVVYAELRRKNMISKSDELLMTNVQQSSIFNDETALHRQTYSYYLVYFSKGGLRYETNDSRLIEFVYPSQKFSMQSTVAIDVSGHATIELTPNAEQSNASILYSSFFNDSPDLTDADLETLINNYDYIMLTHTDRINTATGKVKSLGFSGDINEDGKIIINDSVNKSGNYSYVSTLFARPIRQIIADISATSKFSFQNKGKFSDFISDARLGDNFDLNFEEKFLNQYAIFDSTLVYGRAMAEHFEKIIEHGKTGIVSNSSVYFEKTPSAQIKNEKIIELKKRPVISFNTLDTAEIDSFLVKVQTIDKMYFISALLPSSRISFTDNVTKENTGNVLYSIVPVRKDMEVLDETFIGSFYFGEDNIVDKIKYNHMQGI